MTSAVESLGVAGGDVGGQAEGGLGLHLHQPPAGRHPVALGGSVCNNNIAHRKSIRNVRAGIKDMEEKIL